MNSREVAELAPYLAEDATLIFPAPAVSPAKNVFFFFSKSFSENIPASSLVLMISSLTGSRHARYGPMKGKMRRALPTGTAALPWYAQLPGR